MVSREYIQIQKQREKSVPIDVKIIRRGISQEAKFEKAFSKAEELFEYLVEELRRKESERIPYSDSDIDSFQHSIATLVRYAVTPQKSMDYGYYLLKECEHPLRTRSLHLMILTNMVFRFGENRRITKNMKVALELIKEAVRLRIFQDDPSKFMTMGRDNTIHVFETVSNKVLLHYGLKLSSDKASIVSI
ncbi:hypothetical protein BDB01DRAFT_780813, partial [Pilobolus umbonatus]